jgi:uncharacterized protein YjbI with pentapeptide repeats
LTHLERAALWGAHLEGADLAGANLKDAGNLTQEQVNSAKGDEETMLPEGLTRPAHWSAASSSDRSDTPDNAGWQP